MKTAETLFWASLAKGGPDECWEWQRAPKSSGYGVLQYRHPSKGKVFCYAHRFAYELLRGPIPEGLTIDHLCQNTICVNPAHMEPVTREENSRRVGERRTECMFGHPYTPGNIYQRPDGGGRQCRACIRRRSQTLSAKRKARRHAARRAQLQVAS